MSDDDRADPEGAETAPRTGGRNSDAQEAAQKKDSEGAIDPEEEKK